MATTSKKKVAARKTAATKPIPEKKATRKAAARRPVAKKAAAGKAAGKRPVAPKAAASRTTASRPAAGKAGARGTAVKKAAAPKTAARRPVAGRTVPKKRSAARSPSVARTGSTLPTRHVGPDPDGFFVARIRGEDAMRDAPHQLTEPGGWEEEPAPPPAFDEGLGELPWTYGDDLLVALPRDPRTLFVYWDQGRATLEAAFAHLDRPRVQLWIFARGAEWERVAVVDVSLEARGWYIHDLEPGRTYRAELHVLGPGGQDRPLPGPSNATGLPPRGPSPTIDDRYAKLPWGVPLPKLVGPGMPGGPFSEAARALLASLSGWERFGASSADGGPTSGPPRPSSPTGPVGRKGT